MVKRRLVQPIAVKAVEKICHRSKKQIPDKCASTADLFGELVGTSNILQGPNGCHWDKSQSFSSLFPHLVEEVWEAFCAWKSKKSKYLEEELGDVLYTVIFLSMLADKEGLFSLDSLLRRTNVKMIRRHPHVFGKKIASNSKEAYEFWQEEKRKEKQVKAAGKKLRPLLVAFWEILEKSKNPHSILKAELQNILKEK